MRGFTSLGIMLVSIVPLRSPAPAHSSLSLARGAAQGVEALGAIVGVWQSDTTDGNSALSSCAWTPQRGAVLCEQTITTPGGERHALNLFTFNSTTGSYSFYVLGQPGDPMRPVALAIKGKIWIYGGQAPGPDGRTYRTVNDFSAPGSYTWRQESSSGGEQWTAGAHGQSRRVP